MTQTSSGIFNTSLFSEVTPRSLLAWHRVCMANREWAHVFSQYNAGEILSDRSVSLELLFFHYKGYIHTAAKNNQIKIEQQDLQSE